MTVLADTSVWITYLREGGIQAFDDALERRAVLMCGPVASELLSGTQEAHAEALRRQFSGIGWLTVGEPEAWFLAGSIRSASARSGRPVSLVDTVLAAVAVQADVELWTLDSDFEVIAEVEPRLRLRLLR